MKVGDKIRVLEYPDEHVVGAQGVVTMLGEDYVEVELFGPPNPHHPHVTSFLFYEQEIEVINP